MGFFKGIALGFGGGILVISVIVALTITSLTNLPEIGDTYNIGEPFKFSFYGDNPVVIKVLEATWINDSLFVMVDITNTSNDVYVDSPYQFKLKGEDGKTFVTTVDVGDTNIQEINPGSSLITLLQFDVENTEQEYILGIKEYIGDKTVGVIIG